MKRKIRTMSEEMPGAANLFLFSAVWYVGMYRVVLQQGFQPSQILFFLAGLLPAGQGLRLVQKALYYRKLHCQAVEQGVPRPGRIVNIARKYSWEQGSQNRTYRKAYYVLIVELVNPQNGVPYRIESEPYRLPIYRYLAAPEVQVYLGDTGWSTVIDGFQLKKSRKEPDIPLETATVYLKDFSSSPVLSRLIQLAFLAIMLLMLLGVF